MRKCTDWLRVYATSSVVLIGSALPAHATDVVPFVGLRFGGDVGTQPGNGVTGPTSVTIDSSVSYGGVIDIPLSPPRSLELYYSRQPTKLSGSTAGDVTMSGNIRQYIKRRVWWCAAVALGGWLMKRGYRLLIAW